MLNFDAAQQNAECSKLAAALHEVSTTKRFGTYLVERDGVPRDDAAQLLERLRVDAPRRHRPHPPHCPQHRRPLTLVRAQRRLERACAQPLELPQVEQCVCIRPQLQRACACNLSLLFPGCVQRVCRGEKALLTWKRHPGFVARQPFVLQPRMACFQGDKIGLW